MTFQKAFFVSVIIHIILFGSAISVTEYSKGALWQRHDVLMVSLESPVMKSHAGASLRSEHHDSIVSGNAEAVKQEFDTPAMPKQVAAETSVNVDQTGNHGAGQPDAGVERQGNESLTASGSGGYSVLLPEREWKAIATAIERSKNYPMMARERGIQGVVLVRFKLRISGDVDAVEILKSSGHDILDSASIRTVYRAAPMPYINGWIEVPISYILR